MLEKPTHRILTQPKRSRRRLPLLLLSSAKKPWKDEDQPALRRHRSHQIMHNELMARQDRDVDKAVKVLSSSKKFLAKDTGDESKNIQGKGFWNEIKSLSNSIL